MNRRQFAFWVSFGMFSLAERTGLAGLDRLAAATLRLAEPAPSPQPSLRHGGSPTRGRGRFAYAMS